MISRFIEILRATKRLSGIIMSAPGNLKTSTVELYCKANQLRYQPLIPSQYSFDEVLGFQKIDEKDPTRTVRTKPDWYVNMMKYPDDEWILFVDEISTANPYLQGGLLNLVFNKTLGSGMDLPKKTTIIAAGNYQDNLCSEITMNAALINRFLILNLNKVKFEKKDLDIITDSDEYFDKFMSKDFNELDEILTFIGLNDRFVYDDSLVKSLMNQVKSTCLLNATDKILNSTEDGLIGFTSPRTLCYVDKFLKIANKLGLMDKYCLQIVSDTMGKTNVSDSYIFGRLQQILDSYQISRFRKGNSLGSDFGDLDRLINECGKDGKKWEKLIRNALDSELYKNDKIAKEFLKKVNDKLSVTLGTENNAYELLAEFGRKRQKSLESDI